MSFLNCSICKARVVRVRGNQKYCVDCRRIAIAEKAKRYNRRVYLKNPERVKAQRRESATRFRERHPNWYKDYYKKNGDWLNELSERRDFKRQLEKRVLSARDDLRVHFRVDHSPVLRMPELTCNVCIVRQSKLDCALKLFEENFVQRDVTKGDKPVSSACAVVFAKPLDLVPLETRKAIDWAAAQEEVVREHTKPGDVPRLSPLESLKEWTGRRKRTILKKRKAKTGKRVYG